jgi:orotate phosphoribosyltransferase
MGEFNQEKFNQFILENNIVGFFKEPITLKSGRLSNWYFNWRNAASDVFVLDKLTDHILAFARDSGIEFHCFYGVPEGATKIGVLAQYKLAKQSPIFGPGTHILPMGRGKPKDHGEAKDKYFVGMPQGRTVVVEDVTTTGGSLLTTLSALKEAGVNVVAALGLTNRMELRDDRQSVKQAVEATGVPYYNLSSALQLLPLAYQRQMPGEEIAKAVEDEFEKYGVEKLKLR